jgi:small ligand-binding sensory domain FIST
LWAAHIDGLCPVRLAASRDGVEGFPTDVVSGTLLLLADPFSFPVDGFLEHLESTAPELAVIGGLASASRVAGGNRLVYNDQLHVDGAVGVLLPLGTGRTLVSQGCRPVGDPLTVTGADRNLITELAGQPAAGRLKEMISGLDPETRSLMHMGLHVGVVVDEQKFDFRRGDFLIRNVIGVDEASGAVAVGDVVEVGQTVQFQVRDATTADEDLRELMHGNSAEGALLFTCSARGSHLFDDSDHDAAIIHESLRGAPLAGMFCGGEIGPVGDRNHIHAYTASVLMFD